MLKQAAKLVAVYVRTNRASADELPDLIRAMYNCVAMAGAAPAVVEPPTPVVPIKKSVTPDYIICLEDGKKLKTLKRHLMTACGLTPDEYRDKWGLPADYPMVAPNYAAHRSSLAKRIGLGRKPAATATAPAAAAPAKAGKPKLGLPPKATAKPEPVAAPLVPSSPSAAGQPTHHYPANRWAKPTS